MRFVWCRAYWSFSLSLSGTGMCMSVSTLAKCLDCPQFQVHDRRVWHFSGTWSKKKKREHNGFLLRENGRSLNMFWCCNENVKTIGSSCERQSEKIWLILACDNNRFYSLAPELCRQDDWTHIWTPTIFMSVPIDTFLCVFFSLSVNHNQTTRRKWKRHKNFSWQKIR